jgi:hypothetical protein
MLYTPAVRYGRRPAQANTQVTMAAFNSGADEEDNNCLIVLEPDAHMISFFATTPTNGKNAGNSLCEYCMNTIPVAPSLS